MKGLSLCHLNIPAYHLLDWLLYQRVNIFTNYPKENNKLHVIYLFRGRGWEGKGSNLPLCIAHEPPEKRSWSHHHCEDYEVA